MLLTFEETCATLRDLTKSKFIVAWNHRHDTMNDDADVWIINQGPGHTPQTVEWSQARVERWLREWTAFLDCVDA
jgi:hypothetical protein